MNAILDPVSKCGSPTRMSEEDYRRAERSWRRSGIESLSPSELADEIEFWERHRALLVGDLEAEDFRVCGEEATRNGIAYADARLDELGRQARRHLRSEITPGSTRSSDNLTARFQAARWVDLVGLVETLTAQAAEKSGGERYRLRCPFHQDNRPSLIVYPPGKGFWCFVCGVGGDAVAFVAHLKSCTALEALLIVEELCDTRPNAWGATS